MPGRSGFSIAAVILLLASSTGTGPCGVPGSGNVDLAALVDPLTGTGGHGHTYPGASLPFGMIQLSPDTRLSGWDGCSAYHYSDSVLYGFSHTHLSGTGCSDYGDILIMPSASAWGSEDPAFPKEGHGSRFRHETEKASPGYYAVMLDDCGVLAEMTVTARCGFHRYAFPEGGDAGLLIDLAHRDKVIDSGIWISGPGEVEGFRRSQSWAKDQHVYFVVRFSKPIRSAATLADGRWNDGLRERRSGGLKQYLSFGAAGGEPLMVKVGISAVDVEGARRNLDAEMPGWDFEGCKDAARDTWNGALGRIKIEGGRSGQRTTFYTALYHSLLSPNLYMDVDGRYRGRDLEIHSAGGFEYYTVFSLWDTYRAAHPLLTIIEPRRTVDFIKTFLAQYEQGGLLPVWELAANETGCMIGYHAVPVIADAWAKGIRDFDGALALEAMKHSATRDHLGLKYYREYGFIPSELEGQSVSRTLEYAFDDWCIAQMARSMGRGADFDEYIRRSQHYKNLFDPSSRFMRARFNGGWAVPFDPDEVNFHYTEANAWHYGLYAPQDIEGLIRLHGGRDAFDARLDELFERGSGLKGLDQPDVTGLIGQYAHGNEPSQHMAYLYDYTGRPWKTQKRVREIMDTMYSPGPEGLCGNEDCGQMSAWYVLSALGFYPVTPGQEIYAIGTPLFDKAVIDAGNGRTFTISAEGVSDRNIYIQSASLNGREWTASWISHSQIMAGGEIVFRMGPLPAEGRGGAEDDAPPSGIESGIVCPAPFVTPSAPAFTGTIEIILSCAEKGARIQYTLDGSEPGLESPVFGRPLELSRTTEVRAFASADGMERSRTVTSSFRRISGDVGVKLISPFDPMYSAGGAGALVDGIRGGDDFRTGAWQGYEGIDFEAVLDLGSSRRIGSITAGFLQDQGSWIFMPLSVEFSVSKDGERFEAVSIALSDVPADAEGRVLKDFTTGGLDVEARFVRVLARTPGECPAWHAGAGGKAWIFIDEIIVE